ncbi:MAG: transglycosylase domain-containing protein [Oscillospiraceae bacterium]|nr:transglycosylase domain-containing protein [Oscillospiraceae bacterium]
MKKFFLYVIVFSVACLLILTGCSEKNNIFEYEFKSPKVISENGNQYTLPCSNIVPVSADALNSEYLSDFCKKTKKNADDETINAIWFGENIYGVGLASIVYFNKYASKLNEIEWNALAEIVLYFENNDKSSSIDTVFDYLRKKSEFSDVKFSYYSKYASKIQESAYFDAMIEQIVNDLISEKNYTRQQAFELIYTEGVTIEACYSDEIQNEINSVYTDNSSFSDTNQNIFPQSACVVMDYSGNVLAMAGGNNGNNAYNRAYRTLHSIGSTVKPIALYTPALVQNMITFSSIVEDRPVLLNNHYSDKTVSEQWPSNYNDIYEGDVTITYALRQSKNTVAVRLADMLGIEKCFEFLKSRLHFSTLNDKDCELSSMSMGYLSDGVSITELTASYQMFGNGGFYYAPRFYKRMLNNNGEVIIQRESISESVIDSDDAWIMNRLLYYNVSKPDGIASKAELENGTEVIGKTGTVDNSFGFDTDKLFVGGTPELICTVWVGFDEPDSAINDIKYNEPTEIWKNIMNRISKENQKFIPDNSVIETEYCKKSGEIASERCPEKENGYYKSDAVPNKCSIH